MSFTFYFLYSFFILQNKYIAKTTDIIFREITKIKRIKYNHAFAFIFSVDFSLETSAFKLFREWPNNVNVKICGIC
jgi:hypothetical protein